MKIAILGTRGIPNYYGGFEVCAEEMGVRLAEKGHIISVYCEHLHPVNDTKWKGVHRIKTYNPENRLGTFGQFVYDLNSNLHARKGSYDIILHLGYTSDSVWHPLWSSKSRHIVNMDGMEWKREKYAAPVRRFLKWAEKLATIKADYLVADAIPIQAYLENTYKLPVEYIPYGANIPDEINENVLEKYGLSKGKYDLIIARMIPDNNIEMAIRAKINSKETFPLVIFGDNTKFRRSTEYKYRSDKRIQFQEANFDVETINSLRSLCRYYIHGHSMGGTNPSLLEAMACSCRILAHDNPFNRSVTGSGAKYFSTVDELCERMDENPEILIPEHHLEDNIQKIRTQYNWEVVSNQYEKLFYEVV